MTLPTFIKILQDAGILELYRVSYKAGDAPLQPIYLIPIYYFPPSADKSMFMTLAMPVVNTLALLFKACYSDEIDRSVAFATTWGKQQRDTLHELEAASVIGNVPEIKVSFTAFSHFLVDYACNKRLGYLLEEQGGNEEVNGLIHDLKKSSSEAAHELREVLKSVNKLLRDISSKSPTLIHEYREFLLHDFEENYQSETWQRHLEDWIFKYGKIDPTPYSQFSFRGKKLESIPEAMFTIRDKSFDPSGYFFGLSVEDIRAIKETGILDQRLLGWAVPLHLPE